MKKIISLFQRNYDGDRLVRDEVVPGAEWVVNGEGVATQKLDGTCCMIRGGKLYKRYDVKKGRKPPENFEPAQDADSVTGHQPGWVPVGDGPEDQWHREAFERCIRTQDGRVHKAEYYFEEGDFDGTYELVGPKIQGNPEGKTEHWLVPHGYIKLDNVPRDFEGLKEYLRDRAIEGIVWWRDINDPNCDKVKIKRKDFFKK